MPRAGKPQPDTSRRLSLKHSLRVPFRLFANLLALLSRANSRAPNTRNHFPAHPMANTWSCNSLLRLQTRRLRWKPSRPCSKKTACGRFLAISSNNEIRLPSSTRRISYSISLPTLQFPLNLKGNEHHHRNRRCHRASSRGGTRILGIAPACPALRVGHIEPGGSPTIFGFIGRSRAGNRRWGWPFGR